MPRLAPAPRSPQNSSGSLSGPVRTRSPAAVTSSTASRLSRVSPNRRLRRPTPPPRVSPPTPVWETCPVGQASPYTWAWRSSSPSRAPPAAVATRRAGSTRTSAIGDRSITMPPSQVENPG